MSDWPRVSLGRLVRFGNGSDYRAIEDPDGEYPVIGSGGEFSRATGYIYDGESVLFGRKGTVDRPLYVNGRFWTVDTMYYTRVGPLVVPRWLYYWATTIPFAMLSTDTALPSMTSSVLSSLRLRLPSLDEQRSIAGFLDRETAQIDAMIEAQGYLVDRLEERRRALTAEIVGSVPPDTKLGRLLKHHIRGVRQGWSPQCHPYPRSDDTEWAVLRTGCVNEGRFNPEDNKVLPEALTPRPETVVRRGEIVMSRANTRELLGSAAVVPAEHPQLMLSDKLYALDALPHANPWFIAGVLGTRRLRDLIEIAATGASQSMQNISQFDIVNLPMELPARDIQDEAVKRLAVARHRIDGLASAAVDAITLMQERRSALISAAVTGRIDPCTGKETTPEKARELA